MVNNLAKPPFSLWIVQILWHCLNVVLYPFYLLIPGCRRRLQFEAKNPPFHLDDDFSNSYGIEVSSEGELEQAIPLINRLLSEKEKITLLYCSPSVEKKVLSLEGSSKGHLRGVRLPLLSSRPWNTWVNRLQFKCYIQVRYDFFPDLLVLSRRNPSYLLWASTKGNERRNFLGKYWQELAFSSFDFLIPATSKDEKVMKGAYLGTKVLPYLENRVLQIASRLSAKEDKLKDFYGNTALSGYFGKGKQPLVMGNIWPVDLALISSPLMKNLKQLKADLWLLPHEVNERSISDFEKAFSALGIANDYELVILREASDFIAAKDPEKPRIFLLAVKGILCEFYSEFSLAYVGGGFGRSVHSLLEPFIADCKVFTGPKVYRSTEYDFIQDLSPERISLVHQAKTFNPSLSELKGEFEVKDIETLVRSMQDKFNNLYSSIGQAKKL